MKKIISIAAVALLVSAVIAVVIHAVALIAVASLIIAVVAGYGLSLKLTVSPTFEKKEKREKVPFNTLFPCEEEIVELRFVEIQ